MCALLCVFFIPCRRRFCLSFALPDFFPFPLPLPHLFLFPITFLSNVFVPPQSLPAFLQPIAEWNPVSTLTAATRQLWGNPNPYVGTGLPAQQPALVTVLWVIVILAVFLPVGVRRYRNMSH